MEKIVWVNGCFDIIHYGHIRLLSSARDVADEIQGRVIVGLNTDESVQKIKGRGRPINNYAEREYVLRSIRYVDDVVPLIDLEPSKLILEYKPKVIVKGQDWQGRVLPEAEAIAQVGASLLFIPLYRKKSTSDIINAMLGIKP